jgi:hypothetical protein
MAFATTSFWAAAGTTRIVIRNAETIKGCFIIALATPG